MTSYWSIFTLHACILYIMYLHFQYEKLVSEVGNQCNGFCICCALFIKLTLEEVTHKNWVGNVYLLINRCTPYTLYNYTHFTINCAPGVVVLHKWNLVRRIFSGWSSLYHPPRETLLVLFNIKRTFIFICQKNHLHCSLSVLIILIK